MFPSERASRWIYGVGLPVVAGIVAAYVAEGLVDHVPGLNQAETVLSPTRREGVRIPFDKRLKILLISDETVGRYGEVSGRLRRDIYAQLLQQLERAKARTVLFDLVFDDHSSTDAAFAAALRATSLNVTLMTSYLHPDGDHPNVRDVVQTERGFVGTFAKIPLYDPKTMPHVALGSAEGTGPKDAMGGDESHVFVGAMPEQYQFQGPPLLHGAFEAALQDYGLADVTPVHDVERHVFHCGGYEFQLGYEQEAFVMTPRTKEEIPTEELSKAMGELQKGKTDGYKDAIVVVGRSPAQDDAEIPGFGIVPGVEFVAIMLNTALSRASERLHPPDANVYLPYLGVLGMAAFAVGFRRRPLLSGLGLVALGLLAWAAPRYGADRFAIVLPRLAGSLAIVLGFGGGLLASVSPLFRTEYRHTGHREESTVLFLDVRASTQLLERVGVARYREIVDDLLSRVTKTAKAHGGIVERTLGDGCLIVFRPNSKRHHALRAADAVEPFLAAARAVSDRFDTEVGIGIGLETGMVSGGYVTEGGHRTWSSAGRTVNLAQRLQAASASLARAAIIGPVAAHLIADERSVESLGTIEAKGFGDPVPAATLVETIAKDRKSM